MLTLTKSWHELLLLAAASARRSVRVCCRRVLPPRKETGTHVLTERTTETLCPGSPPLSSRPLAVATAVKAGTAVCRTPGSGHTISRFPAHRTAPAAHSILTSP